MRAVLTALIAAPIFAWSAPAAAQPVLVEPQSRVTVGAFINDIQHLDFKTNSYAIDLYVWFRWNEAGIDPSKTMEFRNLDASDGGTAPEALYDKPETMPDGSLYSIVRYRGAFNTKFRLDAYPFDTQVLKIILEDTILGVDRLVYIPDKFPSVMLDSSAGHAQ